MNYYFLGIFWNPKNVHKVEKRLKHSVVFPATTFQWGLINGLEQAMGSTLRIINCSPVGVFPNHYKSPYLPTYQWSHAKGSDDIEIGCINIPILKQISRTLLVRREIFRRKDLFDKQSVIFVYSLYQPFLMAIRSIPRNIKVVCIVPDLPRFYDLQKTGVARIILRRLNNIIIDRLINRVDSFVVLTSPMMNVLKTKKKPYIVVEGLVDPRNFDLVPGIKKSKALLYSGTLNYAFGIRKIVDAYMITKDPLSELWICGSGEAESYIKKCANIDKRIKYFGVLDWNKLKVLQQSAKYLINPRMNDKEYTRYSFPSKTMEYLASGTPVIAYKLDGIPDEYETYIFWLKHMTIKEIAVEIEDYMKKPQCELDSFGKKARLFVLQKKSSVKQAQNILELINTTLNYI